MNNNKTQNFNFNFKCKIDSRISDYLYSDSKTLKVKVALPTRLTKIQQVHLTGDIWIF